MSTATSGASNADKMAKIRYLGYGNPAPYVGQTIKQVREKVTPLWGVPNDAFAYKGKEKLDENYIIQAQDEIEFIKRQGEKG